MKHFKNILFEMGINALPAGPGILCDLIYCILADDLGWYRVITQAGKVFKIRDIL